MTTTVADPALFLGLYDDASAFPPGSLPLDRAVAAHVAHRAAPHSALVGPLVVAAADLALLAEVSSELPAGTLDLSVTVPTPAEAGAARAAADRIPAARLVALEVAVPADLAATAVVPLLVAALDGPVDATSTVGPTSTVAPTVYVEVPRDGRRAELFVELAASPYLAKLRTGGVTADLHPDEAELAAAIAKAVQCGVPFKATAGLHHAVRNTDRATGFEQHGFLNVLAATGAALAGAETGDLQALLAERDPARLVERVRATPARTRTLFLSFGTCDIAEPATELAGLGLLDPALVEGLS